MMRKPMLIILNFLLLLAISSPLLAQSSVQYVYL